MVTAQILKVTTEVKDGTRPYRPVTNITLKARPPRFRQNQHGYATDVERYGGSKVWCGRSKVFVIFTRIASVVETESSAQGYR